MALSMMYGIPQIVYYVWSSSLWLPFYKICGFPTRVKELIHNKQTKGQKKKQKYFGLTRRVICDRENYLINF